MVVVDAPLGGEENVDDGEDLVGAVEEGLGRRSPEIRSDLDFAEASRRLPAVAAVVVRRHRRGGARQGSGSGTRCRSGPCSGGTRDSGCLASGRSPCPSRRPAAAASTPSNCWMREKE
ncbi:hypothetical protein TIFTF001_039019 [Ficus carica]|uniref:Uncharacterized protein n=1 Tax=Ficus carica TaxID=3494 RepID=A0AA88EDB8_FICCA|nr:hypothetical protein TIFTF001_039019 [Ficus carica]